MKTIRLILVLLLNATIVFISCRKTEFPIEKTANTPGTLEDKFFNSHRSSDPQENAIVEFIKRANSKNPFIEATVKKIGYPRWDKAIKSKKAASVKVASTTRTNTATSQSDYDIYYVPFVKDSANHVNASMVIKASSTDTSISYLCDWQYARLQNDNNKLNDQAENFAIFFMNFDKLVFGHTKFRITDTSIFRSNNHSPREVVLNTQDTNQGVKTDLYALYCQYVTITFTDCPYIPLYGHCSGPGGSCDNCPSCISSISYIYCWEEWSDIPTGWGGGGGGGGGGGWDSGGSGSGGGGDGSVPPDPCSGQSIQYTSGSQNIVGARVNSMPCNGDPGWTPIGNYADINRTDADYDTGDDNNNTQGNYDNTNYSDYDDQTQTWPIIQNVISTSDFVGWNRILHPGWQCMDYAKAQILKKGNSISNYFDPGQTIQIYTDANGVDKIAAKNGVGYLISALQRGIPVIVGVDDEPGSPNQGTDKTTDHFIVIVGTGIDANGIYFTFYDNASGIRSQGTDANNKLYYNPTTGLITGKSQTDYAQVSYRHDYIVTQIRKSK